MILTCDKCFTRYMVSLAAIPPHGRTVKCVKCGNSWLQHRDDIIHGNDDDTPIHATFSTSSPPQIQTVGLSAIPAGSSLPVIRIDRTPPTPFLLKILPPFIVLLLTMLALILYKDTVLRVVPTLQPIYNSIGLYDTSGITLHEIALSKEEDGIYLYGKIVNSAPKVQYVPDIRVTVLDGEKHPLSSYTIPAPGSRMEPTAVFLLHNKLPATIQNAAYITVDAGNKLELFLR